MTISSDPGIGLLVSSRHIACICVPDCVCCNFIIIDMAVRAIGVLNSKMSESMTLENPVLVT